MAVKKTTNKPTNKNREKVLLLVGTRKGAFLYYSDPQRKEWKLSGPHFLGCIVHHLVLDPRDKKTLLCASRTGHLGPTVFRSTDFGKTWKEAEKPPAFPKVPEGQKGLVVDHVFWLTPGHATEPGVWYAGTSPQGLFRSEDHGKTWAGIDGFNLNPQREKWTGGPGDGTPDGPKMHSVLVDPRDPKHLYIGMSSGGIFESLDRGKSWKPLNKGVAADFLPDKNAEYGHDPHRVVIHPLMPDRLYHQNHCGIYRLDRPGEVWERIGNNMPKSVGDIGFSIEVHPRNPDMAWVFPMDGTTVWPRTSPDGKPSVYRTKNAGKSWQRQDRGLPKKNAWFTVKRQAFSVDAKEKAGLYFGTTQGEVWMSRNEGESWDVLTRYLPEIYSVETAML